MKEKSLIKKNILHFLEIEGITKYKFYQKTGITNGILNQNNGISEENIVKFLSAYPKISHTWLLTGEGSMLREECGKNSQNINIGQKNIARNNISVQNQDLLEIVKDKEKIIKAKDKEISKLVSIIENLTNKISK